MTILVATESGVHHPEPGGAPGLGGHDVTALDASGKWAVSDGKTLHHYTDAGWEEVAVVPGDPATALVAAPDGVFVGTAGAHLLRLDRGRLVPVPGFDEAPGRDTWGTPWAARPTSDRWRPRPTARSTSTCTSAGSCVRATTARRGSRRWTSTTTCIR